MRWTLSSKIILSVSGLLAMLSIAVAALTFVEMRRAARAEQEGLMDVLNYTFEILLSQDARPSLQRVIENSATLGRVRKIVIVDRHRRVMASSDRREIGRTVESAALNEFLDRAAFQRTRREIGGDLIILQPLRGGRSMGGATGDIVGAAEITLSLTLIDSAARAGALRLLTISLGSYLVLSVVLAIVLRVLVTGPVRSLATAAQRFRDGDRSLRTEIRRGDEIGVLSSAFDGMANQVESVLAGLEEQVASRTRDLTEQRTALEQALAELQTSTAARLALAETVRELSTPVIKLYDGVIVMPIIGNMDTQRAEQIQSSLLAGIEAHAAEEVILDLTGVAVVDTQVAAGLLRAARAAQLLGASVTIVGITGRVAQSIVHLEVDLSGIDLRADLQGGLTHALRKRRGRFPPYRGT